MLCTQISGLKSFLTYVLTMFPEIEYLRVGMSKILEQISQYFSLYKVWKKYFKFVSFHFIAVRKSKWAKTPQDETDILMDNIWNSIIQSKCYAWNQLHSLDGLVYNLLYPGYKWPFPGSGNRKKSIKLTYFSVPCL